MGRFKLQPQINNVESDSIFLVHIPAIGFFPETAQLSYVFGTTIAVVAVRAHRFSGTIGARNDLFLLFETTCFLCFI